MAKEIKDFKPTIETWKGIPVSENYNNVNIPDLTEEDIYLIREWIANPNKMDEINYEDDCEQLDLAKRIYMHNINIAPSNPKLLNAELEKFSKQEIIDILLCVCNIKTLHGEQTEFPNLWKKYRKIKHSFRPDGMIVPQTKGLHYVVVVGMGDIKQVVHSGISEQEAMEIAAYYERESDMFCTYCYARFSANALLLQISDFTKYPPKEIQSPTT